jgi:hypothetical protein
MSLYPIKTTAPAFQFTPYTGELPAPSRYNNYLVTPPRIYQEEVDRVQHFFYEPGSDQLVAYIWFKTYFWPGWGLYLYEWDANTGDFVRRTAVSWSIVYPNHAGVGSYGKIYTTWNYDSTVSEVKWGDLHKPTNGWSIDPSTWTPTRTFFLAVVNREDNLLAGVHSLDLEIWDISGTPARQASLRCPETPSYMCYEDRQRLWIITQGGLIAKANYQKARWEMLSSVQNPSSDAQAYLCAFDTLRNRLAVFRARPAAADGACQCQLEFYRPLIKVASDGLTDPVPTASLRCGKKITFVAHLHGDRGEGLPSYVVKAALPSPALGTLLNSCATTELNGALEINYQAPAAAGEDTLQLSATITDGEMP